MSCAKISVENNIIEKNRKVLLFNNNFIIKFVFIINGFGEILIQKLTNFLYSFRNAKLNFIFLKTCEHQIECFLPKFCFINKFIYSFISKDCCFMISNRNVD